VNEKQVTSIKIDPELWKEAKKHAIDEGVSLGELIEKLLQQELRKKQ